MERDRVARPALSLAPEHDWAAAATVIRPAFRAVGMTGTDGVALLPSTRGGAGKPIVRAGVAGLPLVYVIPGWGFDVVVAVEHLLAWGVGPDAVHAAAMANLAEWSAGAPLADEINGDRRVVWSDHGEGLDAVRILLPEVRARIVADLGAAHRIVVGLPERDLLVAARITEGDAEFVAMFADYVADRAASADEPIDSRIFELVEGELVAGY